MCCSTQLQARVGRAVYKDGRTQNRGRQWLIHSRKEQRGGRAHAARKAEWHTLSRQETRGAVPMASMYSLKPRAKRASSSKEDREVYLHIRLLAASAPPQRQHSESSMARNFLRKKPNYITGMPTKQSAAVPSRSACGSCRHGSPPALHMLRPPQMRRICSALANNVANKQAPQPPPQAHGILHLSSTPLGTPLMKCTAPGSPGGSCQLRHARSTGILHALAEAPKHACDAALPGARNA